MMSFATYDQHQNYFSRDSHNSPLSISILIDMFTEHGVKYETFGKCMSGGEIGIKIKKFYSKNLLPGWINSHPNLRRIGTLMQGGVIDFNNISGAGNGLYQLNISSFSQFNLEHAPVSSNSDSLSYSSGFAKNYATASDFSRDLHYSEDYVNVRTLSFNEIKEMHHDLIKSFRLINGKYGPQIERKVIIPILASSISRIRRLQKRAIFIGYDIIMRLLDDNLITYHPEENNIFILKTYTRSIDTCFPETYQVDESTYNQKMYLENKEKELNAIELQQKEAFLENQKQLYLKKEELVAREIKQANNAVLEQQMLLDLKKQRLALLEKEEQISIAIKEKKQIVEKVREKPISLGSSIQNLKIIVEKSSKKTCSKDFSKNNSEVLRRSPRLSKNK